MRMFDYETKTTFWDDFKTAEAYGLEAVVDTYNRAFAEWKDNVEYVTELSMVVNWRLWAVYQTNEGLGRLYDNLWRQTHDWCLNNLKGDDLTYYIRTTD